MRQKGILHRQKEKSMRVMQVDVICDVVARVRNAYAVAELYGRS